MDRHNQKNIFYIVIALLSLPTFAHEKDSLWVRAKAQTKEERTFLSDAGMAIDSVTSSEVSGTISRRELLTLEKKGLVLESKSLSEISALDFPRSDSRFNNYDEMTTLMRSWAKDHPDFVTLDSIGKTVEGRDILHLRITTHPKDANSKPGLVFMGGHHAREHISVEMPLKLAEYLINAYVSGTPEVVRLIENRDIHIIPSVNPDGSEYDISAGNYRYWRKNRSMVSPVTPGVDLNRNYGFGWGGGGASSDPASETYRGPNAFSEPESQAIKKFVEAQTNISILLSFHTFSELVLYPWGHKYDQIDIVRDFQVHKVMAETMAQWNGYTPEQSSELYIASGDTTDWSYGEHKIISFTFELDPSDMFSGGFYPGAQMIDVVFNKNLKPCLYLMEYADNPYRTLDPTEVTYGLNTPFEFLSSF